MVDFYNLDANDEKNEVAQKSAEFIDERIGIINRELGTAETELADFKQRSGLTDLTSDARLALEESSKYEQQLTENATQLRLVESLRNYVNNPKNANEVIPANVGLQDQNLGSIINQYNTMLIERKAFAPYLFRKQSCGNQYQYGHRVHAAQCADYREQCTERVADSAVQP